MQLARSVQLDFQPFKSLRDFVTAFIFFLIKVILRKKIPKNSIQLPHYPDDYIGVDAH